MEKFTLKNKWSEVGKRKLYSVQISSDLKSYFDGSVFVDCMVDQNNDGLGNR